MEFPNDLKYTKDHEWVRVSGDKGVVGITDYAQGQLGDIVFVELPEVGRALKAGDVFGVVESVKTVSDLYCPVSGEVQKVNEELESAPEKVNGSPYGQGWILEVTLKDPGELKKLLSAEEYRKYVEEEAGK